MSVDSPIGSTLTSLFAVFPDTAALLIAAATCSIKSSESSPRPGDIEACEWLVKAQQLSAQWGNVSMWSSPSVAAPIGDDPIVE